MPPSNNAEITNPDCEGGEAEPYDYTSNVSRRVMNPRSRSPSPTGPPICSTPAVIKAQAFGALRGTRAWEKKGEEEAPKAAMEDLETRGIGIGTARLRPEDDDADVEEDGDDDAEEYDNDRAE